MAEEGGGWGLHRERVESREQRAESREQIGDGSGIRGQAPLLPLLSSAARVAVVYEWERRGQGTRIMVTSLAARCRPPPAAAAAQCRGTWAPHVVEGC